MVQPTETQELTPMTTTEMDHSSPDSNKDYRAELFFINPVQQSPGHVEEDSSQIPKANLRRIRRRLGAQITRPHHGGQRRGSVE